MNAILITVLGIKIYCRNFILVFIIDFNLVNNILYYLCMNVLQFCFLPTLPLISPPFFSLSILYDSIFLSFMSGLCSLFFHLSLFHLLYHPSEYHWYHTLLLLHKIFILFNFLAGTLT